MLYLTVEVAFVVEFIDAEVELLENTVMNLEYLCYSP